MKKHHPFTHTHIEHHEDGSHTVHHVHKDGAHKDVKSAVADHDGLMDHMMDHTSAPNPGEADAEAAPHALPQGGAVPPPTASGLTPGA
jgi:hypothetical protein